MMPTNSAIQNHLVRETIQGKITNPNNSIDRIFSFSEYPFFDFILSIIILLGEIFYILNGVIALIFFSIGDIIELYNANLGQFLQVISFFISMVGLIISTLMRIIIKSEINMSSFVINY